MCKNLMKNLHNRRISFLTFLERLLPQMFQAKGNHFVPKKIIKKPAINRKVLGFFVHYENTPIQIY